MHYFSSLESTIWSTVPNSVHRKTIDDIDDKGEMPERMYEFGIRRKVCKTFKDMKALLKDKCSKETDVFQAKRV